MISDRIDVALRGLREMRRTREIDEATLVNMIGELQTAQTDARAIEKLVAPLQRILAFGRKGPGSSGAPAAVQAVS